MKNFLKWVNWVCVVSVAFTMGLLAEHYQERREMEVRVGSDAGERLDWISAGGHKFRIEPPIDSVAHVKDCEKCVREKK